MFNPIDLIPVPYRYIVYAVLVLGLVGGGFYAGVRWDKSEIASIQLANANLAVKAAKTAAATAHAADQVAINSAAADAKTQADLAAYYKNLLAGVPAHVSNNSHCITFGLVRVLQSAARGSVGSAGPDPAPGKSDDACAPITWTAFAADLLDDYANANANAGQLTDLQTYITQYVATYNAGAKP